MLGTSLDPVTTNFIEPAFINDTVSPGSTRRSKTTMSFFLSACIQSHLLSALHLHHVYKASSCSGLQPAHHWFMWPKLVCVLCVQSIFNILNGSCATDTSTALLNQATSGLGDSFFRSSFNCTQETPVWSASTDDVDRALFCGYKQVGPFCWCK